MLEAAWSAEGIAGLPLWTFEDHLGRLRQLDSRAARDRTKSLFENLINLDHSIWEDQAALISNKTRNQAGTPYRLVERSRLILMSAEGVSNTEQGRRLNIDRQRARRWRARWAENEERLAAAEQEGASEKELTKLLSFMLADHERPGAPSTFTAEQLTLIIGVACAEAPRLHEEEGTHVISTDEKTGIQALERLHPTLPSRPGKTERIEFEYRRHGALCLIANFEVATGKAVLPTIGPTRTEEDFAAHIGRTIDADPNTAWIFVLDQLNTRIGSTGTSRRQTMQH
jgi:hypothetical protein